MARHVSPITQKGHRAGEPSANKGKKFPVDILKPEEIVAMSEHCNVGAMGLRNRAILACLWGVGSRVGELCGLEVRDINMETRAFRIHGTKTACARRTVGCNATAFAPIKDWLDVRAEMEVPGPYVFPCLSKWERGNRIKAAQVRQMVHHLAGKAGLEYPGCERRIHPHAFRHTFASELWRERVDLLLISKALGHANIGVTQIYINHLCPDDVVNATAGRVLTGVSF